MKGEPKPVVKKVGKRRSLVERLRTTCRRLDQSGDMDDYSVSNRNITNIADKLDAVGEALAYLIDTKDNKGYAEGFAIGLKTGRGIKKDLKKRRGG